MTSGGIGGANFSPLLNDQWESQSEVSSIVTATSFGCVAVCARRPIEQASANPTIKTARHKNCLLISSPPTARLVRYRARQQAVVSSVNRLLTRAVLLHGAV